MYMYVCIYIYVYIYIFFLVLLLHGSVNGLKPGIYHTIRCIYIYIYMCVCNIIYIYIHVCMCIMIYIYVYIITGKEMKLDLGTQSFMQNTFTIFSLTIFNVKNYGVKVSSFLREVMVLYLRRKSS